MNARCGGRTWPRSDHQRRLLCEWCVPHPTSAGEGVEADVQAMYVASPSSVSATGASNAARLSPVSCTRSKPASTRHD